MARAVTCFATKERGNSEQFIKINGHYFKNQQVYDEFVQNKQLYKQIISFIAVELMGYSSGQPFPPLIGKRLKELEFYDRKIIYATLLEIKENLIYAMAKNNFKNDSGKIAYIFAAIKNNINDVYKREIEKEKVANKSKVASEKFVEQVTMFDINSEIKHTKQKVRDVSKFLEDE